MLTNSLSSISAAGLCMEISLMLPAHCKEDLIHLMIKKKHQFLHTLFIRFTILKWQ